MLASPPDPVFIELTGRCNLSCAHCYAVGSGDCDLELDLAQQVISDVAKMGVFGIVLSGGEPMLYPALTGVVAHAADVGLGVGITTNGTCWSKTLLRQLAGRVTNLQISIDSSDRAVHDAMRGQGGAFDRATSLVVAARREGIRTTVACVITKDNLSDIYGLASLCRDLGANEFRALKLVPVGRGRHIVDRLITAAQVAYLKRTLLELGQTHKGQMIVSADSEFELSLNRFCTAGRSVITVRSDGGVVPCSFLRSREYILGSVKTESLVDIWCGQAIREFRRSRGVIDEGCRNCRLFDSCGGGCRASRTYATQAIYCPNFG